MQGLGASPLRKKVKSGRVSPVLVPAEGVFSHNAVNAPVNGVPHVYPPSYAHGAGGAPPGKVPAFPAYPGRAEGAGNAARDMPPAAGGAPVRDAVHAICGAPSIDIDDSAFDGALPNNGAVPNDSRLAGDPHIPGDLPFEGALPLGRAANEEIVALGQMNMPPGLAQHYLAAFTLLLATIIRTFLDVLSILTYILKYPFVLFLTVFVLLSLISHVVDMAAESLTPICVVFPSFPVCGVTTAAADALTWTFGNIGRKPARAQERFDFPGLMAVQSRTLDQLLARSTAGSQLALSVKHAELAVKDLGIVVRSSNLTSKDVLARSLDEFAQEAKIVGRQLQQLSAKLYGAVDTVLAFDDYALRAIMGAQAAGSDVTHTAAQMFKFTMSALSTEVARVILEATTVASRLDTLEEKLSVIRAVCEQERLIAEAAMDEVLSQLWTLVGGNKVKLQQLGKQVDILRNVDWYRSLSVAHVVATTETLLRVESELGELRDKLSAPSLAGDTIPIEVHITSIERSARRLHEDKLKARSDSNHATYGPSVSQRLKDTQLALVEAV